jgi:hypothetical protein
MKLKRLTARTLLAFALAAALIGALAAVGPAFGAASTAPPNAHYRGKSYGDWSAAWWRWAFAEPANQSPIADTTGALCGVDQTEKVFFLAGSSSSTPLTRSCTVRPGTPLFFPTLNAECSFLEGNGGPNNNDINALRDCATGIIDLVTPPTHVTVDGSPVGVVRAQSPPFTVTFAAGNAFGVPSGTTTSVADGYYVLLHPLPPGLHIIHITADAPSIPFSQDVTYNLTVASH